MFVSTVRYILVGKGLPVVGLVVGCNRPLSLLRSNMCCRHRCRFPFGLLHKDGVDQCFRVSG